MSVSTSAFPVAVFLKAVVSVNVHAVVVVLSFAFAAVLVVVVVVVVTCDMPINLLHTKSVPSLSPSPLITLFLTC